MVAEDFDERPDKGLQTPLSSTSTDEEIHFMIQHAMVMEAHHHIQRDHFAFHRLHQSMTGTIASRAAALEAISAGSVPRSHRVYADEIEDPSMILCRQWLDNLPEIMQYDVDNIRGHRFWPSFIHIFY